MLTVRHWLHPRNSAVIDGTAYDCIGRFDFDRRGGGMVVLRHPGLSSTDPLDGALAVDLDDLAELEEHGRVVPAEPAVAEEVSPMPHMAGVSWLETQLAEGRLVQI
jgi:hypothetical protein